MTLRCKRGTEQDVADLGPSRPPRGVPMARWARGMPEGRREGKSLAWYRGQQSGRIDAILTLQKWGFTRIANRLQKLYNFNDKGDIAL